MAVKQSTIKAVPSKPKDQETPETEEEMIRSAHELAYAGHCWLEGLRSFLRGIEYSKSIPVVMDLEFTSAFGYMLDMAHRNVDEANRTLVKILQAQKGGAE